MTETRKPYTVESFKAGKKAETREPQDLRGVQFLKLTELHGYSFRGFVNVNGYIQFWNAELHGYSFRGFVNGYMQFWNAEGVSDYKAFALFEKED
jgi:hypothetical protein